MSLVNKVELLLSSCSGFEKVDDLLAGKHMPSMKRADYLLQSRKIIIEQKILQADPVENPQRFINELMDDGRFLIFGTTSTREVFSKLPDGDRLHRKMIQRVVNVVTGDLEHADKQTRDTREIFSIPDATGVVVLINASASMLDLELIGYAVNQVFMKRNPGGDRQYRNNAAVLLFSSFDTVHTASGMVSRPILITNQIDQPTRDHLNMFFGEIMREWATMHGLSPHYSPPTASTGKEGAMTEFSNEDWKRAEMRIALFDAHIGASATFSSAAMNGLILASGAGAVGVLTLIGAIGIEAAKPLADALIFSLKAFAWGTGLGIASAGFSYISQSLYSGASELPVETPDDTRAKRNGDAVRIAAVTTFLLGIIAFGVGAANGIAGLATVLGT